MYKTIMVDDMFGIYQLLTEQRYRPDLNRYRSLHIYRGMPNADYKLLTSLRRNCKEKSKALEPVILANFTKYAALEDPSIESSIWKQMILGQHHGLPTRLYDWSFSPLTSLHFATSEANLDKTDKHDAVVWRIDVDELHELLPPKYQKVMKETGTTVFSLKMLESVCKDPAQYDEDMQGKAMLIVEPPSIDQRIINQYSFFSIFPADMESMEDFLNEHTQKTLKYVISKDLKWQVRDLLDQLNISERIVYPGLDGLSRWLARHYYVREDS
ncbi:MAG: FRG domain-containing protein [Lachnospiraceae bacterium]|nr:FRG domain-containing protein [Lachnospiraceae bacterium]